MPLSVVDFIDTSERGSSCGYCKSSKSSYSYGMWAHAMTVEDYQALIDRGWRRSGRFCYKPTATTCCPMYTVRCHATELRLSKSQKKVLRRMHNYLAVGRDGTETAMKTKPTNVAKTLEDYLCQPLPDNPAHTLQVKLVRSSPASPELRESFDEEHRLYVKYQTTIHGETLQECGADQFQEFLVDSPLLPNESFGSFHQQYWLDDRLLAVGVVDVLPGCLSAVYFFYDPEYAFLSLGTYGSLREIATVREMQVSVPSLNKYYMGYYIHSCPKMRYKGQYAPSFLLCPVSYTWRRIEECKQLLDATSYTKLNADATGTEDEVDLDRVLVLDSQTVTTGGQYLAHGANVQKYRKISLYAKLVGLECAERMVLLMM